MFLQVKRKIEKNRNRNWRLKKSRSKRKIEREKREGEERRKRKEKRKKRKHYKKNKKTRKKQEKPLFFSYKEKRNGMPKTSCKLLFVHEYIYIYWSVERTQNNKKR